MQVAGPARGRAIEIRVASGRSEMVEPGEAGLTALPSLRALDQAQATRIWLAADATDMRCSFYRSH